MVSLSNRLRKLLAAGLCCAALFSLAGCGTQTAALEDEEPAASESSGLKLGYATEGVTVVEDGDALQKAVDEMYAKAAEDGVALEYRNDASSTDGITFDLYLANSKSNKYDMFIDIYADAALTDELYLSDLLAPGMAFSTLTLDRALESGTHRVYVVHTQVEDDWETVHAQVIITMDFTVTE